MSAPGAVDDDGAFTGIVASELPSAIAIDTSPQNTTTSSTSSATATFQGGVLSPTSISGGSSTAARETAATPTERTGTQGPTPTETTDVSATGGNLSTGTKAGIAVGCIVVVLALILFWFFVLRRLQRRRRMGGRVEEVKAPAMTITTSNAPTQVGSDVGEVDVGGSDSRVELPGSEVLKRGPVVKKVELMTNANRHELHGNSSQVGLLLVDGRGEQEN